MLHTFSDASEQDATERPKVWRPSSGEDAQLGPPLAESSSVALDRHCLPRHTSTAAVLNTATSNFSYRPARKALSNDESKSRRATTHKDIIALGELCRCALRRRGPREETVTLTASARRAQTPPAEARTGRGAVPRPRALALPREARSGPDAPRNGRIRRPAR